MKPSISPSAEPVVWTGIITSLLLGAVQLAVGHGIITGDQAVHLTPQVAVLANGVASLLPFLFSLITRQAVTPNASLPSSVVTTAAALPVQVTTESSPVANVLSSTPLSAGTEGTIAADTRRWSTDGDYLGTIGPAKLAFVSLDNIEGPIHGHFYRASTTPNVYVEASAVSFDTAAPTTNEVSVAQAPVAAVVASGLTQIPPPALLAPNPPATVLPGIIGAFVAHNPQLDPAFAAQIAQIMGQSGDSAQALTTLLRDLTLSPVIPGMVVNPAGLPVFFSKPVADGTVLVTDGLGTTGFGDYIAGAFYAPPEGGHTSTAVGYGFTLQGMTAIITVVTPGTGNVLVGPVGSSVL